MSEVSFGVFDWIDRGTAPLNQLYEERLRLLAAADEAGFYCYHLAEHHATPLGMAPSPALFLTAATQRTRRIRLGPLVYLLPLYDPLRLIEEVAMLDQLSGGRLELRVGRGVSPYELRNFGVDPENSRPMFEEALAVLLAGLTQERLNFAGRHYNYQNVPMELHSLQQPYPPLWYPTHAGAIRWVPAGSAHRDRAGRLGLECGPGIVCTSPLLRQSPGLRAHVPTVVLDRENVAVEGGDPLLSLHRHSEIAQRVADIALDLAAIELRIVVHQISRTTVS